MEWSADSGPIYYWLFNTLGCEAENNADTITIADIHIPTLNWVKIEISKVGSQEQWKNFGFNRASGAKSKPDYLL